MPLTEFQSGCIDFGRARWLCWICGLAWVLTAQAHAQDYGVVNPGTRTDFYGNARPSYNERRIVGSFANDVQRRALSGYQEIGRRVNRRGGEMPFGLAGDRAYRLSLAARNVSYTSAKTSLGFSLPSLWPRANTGVNNLDYNFSKYGGFSPRGSDGQSISLDEILNRQEHLIGANALDAPVQRALWRLSASSGLTTYPREQHYPPVLSDLPADDAPSLDQALRDRVIRTHDRSRGEGWAMFKQGEYRHAARVFGSALALSPDDHESRLGQVFCYVANDALKTSVVTLRQLLRREPNPFELRLDLTARIGEASDLRNMRSKLRLFAQAFPDEEDARALYVLVLWYLGDREAAIREANAFSRLSPNSAYREWQARMAAVHAAGALP